MASGVTEITDGRKSLSVGSDVLDVAYDSRNAGWWILTVKPTELLRLDPDMTITTRITDLVQGDRYRMCLDTNRDQIILTDRSQGLICLSGDGNLVRKIEIPDHDRLSSVTHCPRRDVTIVTGQPSTGVNDCLWIISSETGQILNKIENAESYRHPAFICHQNVGDSQCHIVVSYGFQNFVNVYTCTGELIRKIPTEGIEDGQLRYPAGVSADCSGRIIACDLLNFRVLSTVWDGTGEWEVLLKHEQLDGAQPWCGSVSADGKQMLVAITREREDIIKLFDI